MALTLMYLTNKADIAAIAQRHGVDRIFIDLETTGKAERQKGRDSVQSKHHVDDIARIRRVLHSSELLVRVNPLHGRDRTEIEAAIEAGADIIMLPMWRTVGEAKRFLDCVAGRAKTCLLLETKEAVCCLDEVLRLPEIDEIHVGLNDLHIILGQRFMFEPLADGTVGGICDTIRRHGIKYGFGGIARIGHGLLPAEKVIMEHYRLGSTMAILSRSFCDMGRLADSDEAEGVFKAGMSAIREFEKTLAGLDADGFEANRLAVVAAVSGIVGAIREGKGVSA